MKYSFSSTNCSSSPHINNGFAAISFRLEFSYLRVASSFSAILQALSLAATTLAYGYARPLMNSSNNPKCFSSFNKRNINLIHEYRLNRSDLFERNGS